MAEAVRPKTKKKKKIKNGSSECSNKWCAKGPTESTNDAQRDVISDTNSLNAVINESDEPLESRNEISVTKIDSVEISTTASKQDKTIENGKSNDIEFEKGFTSRQDNEVYSCTSPESAEIENQHGNIPIVVASAPEASLSLEVSNEMGQSTTMVCLDTQASVTKETIENGKSNDIEFEKGFTTRQDNEVYSCTSKSAEIQDQPGNVPIVVASAPEASISLEVSNEMGQSTTMVCLDTQASVTKEKHTELTITPAQVTHKKVYASEKSPQCKDEKLKPFSELELNQFYYNGELSQVELFVDEFLKNSSSIQNEFYDLLYNYHKSREKLIDIKTKITNLKVKFDEDQKGVWVIKQCIISAEGICQCGNVVSQQQKYQEAQFQDEICKEMGVDLSDLRNMIHEAHQLESYNSQVFKIRVDNYINKIFSSHEHLTKLPEDSPITASLPHQIDANIIPVLREVHECISVLFGFKRFGFLEEQFDTNTTLWLDLLVATLQHIGTLPDFFFLLNHLLRCPPGTIPKFSKYIQFPSFDLHPSIPIWDRPQVHHFIVMLATLTLPIKQREEFLAKYKGNRKDVILGRSISWTLVDEDKEEDEHLANAWCLPREQDLLAIFEQFPFSELLVAFLHIDKSDGLYTHLPSSTNSHAMMRQLAFVSCLVKLLGQIFETYSLLRYRQFVKFVSRTIRLATQVMADHWSSYRCYHIDIVGDSFTEPPKNETSVSSFALERLQIEFDQFFLRASHIIISSHSSGAIQFLSTMPFEAVSLSSMWIILRMILDTSAGFSTMDVHSPKDLPCVRSLEVSPSEGIFLLTALSNMAISRCPSEDGLFIETVAKLILEISFANASIADVYSKNGHDLLTSISTYYPVIISVLLHQANSLKEKLRKVLCYIFDTMPLQMWKPTYNDLELIRTWLLECPISSEENLLARSLLLKMNYGYDKNSAKLFLPRNYHYLVAILLVEAYGVSFPDYAGGIQQLSYTGLGIIGQVSKIAVSSYNKLMYSQAHNEFLACAWDVILMLKLHESDVASSQMEEEEEEEEDVWKSEYGPTVSWSYKTLIQLKDKPAYELDLYHSPELLNVLLAVKTNGPLAMYAAFAMTKHGHFCDQFLTDGIRYLQSLNDKCFYDAVLHIIANVSSLFLGCPEKLASDSFLKLLVSLIHIDVDRAGYSEKLWQYFVIGTYSQKLAALVTSTVLQGMKLSDKQAQASLKFWLFLLLNLPFWSKDCGVLYQMDCLCKVAFTVPSGLDIMVEMFSEEYKELIKSQERRGLLSSVMSWISNNQSISLLPSLTTDFCYFAYVILSLETKFEVEIGLWKELTTELCMDDSLTIDQAYKKVLSSLKSLYIPPLHMLSIYRWGEQAMVTPKDHPFLPLIWQKFFTVFLQKPTDDTGLTSRIGIGLRFFESFSSASVAKKMKGHLATVASYHQDKSISKDRAESQVSTWSMAEKEHAYSEQFHLTLSRLYQGLALWLEESRLHDANLYLSSLPDVYIPDLLLNIFQGNQDMWHDYVDSHIILVELETLASLWSHYIVRPLVTKPKNYDEDELVQVTAGQRIVKRLNAENKPQSPLQYVQPKLPVSDVAFHTLLSRPHLIQEIGNHLEVIVRYAQNASSVSTSHVMLDDEYLEFLPDLYEMITRNMTVWIPCDGTFKKRSRGVCAGPARVNVSFRELRLRERTYTHLQDNRNAFSALVENCLTEIPVDLSLSVVHIENIIQKLTKGYETLNELQRQELQASARRLFYFLAQLIDDDIKKCSPTIQFFSSAVESLGKVFIAENSTEQFPLLETILEKDSSVAFLAPHFSPRCSPTQFVALHSKLVERIEAGKETTIFVLLSKFDISSWLASNPPPSERTAVVTSVMTALNKLGVKPNNENSMLLEIIRSHMNVLFKSNINEFFSKILSELLNGSSKQTMAPVCWDDFNCCVGFDKNTSPRDTRDDLSLSQAKESIHFLAVYFQNEVDQLNQSLESLYEKWQPYTKHLNKFLFGIFQYLIRQETSQMNIYNEDQTLRTLWEDLISVYQPWILPRTPGNIWSLLRVESVLSLLQSFTETMRYLTENFHTESGYCVLLNILWSYYYNCIVPGVKKERSLEIFHSLFTTLPWSMFCPTLQDLGFVLESHELYPATFRFFGCVLAEIDWKTIVDNYISSGNAPAISRFHQQLLQIFVMLAANKDVLDSTSSKLVYLFTQAKTFNWKTLGLEDAAHACKWYAENADSSLILERESPMWNTLNLLLEVCCYFKSDDSMSDISIAKRNLYVQVIVTLLTRCSSCRNRTYEFRLVVEKLLRTIESTIAFNTENPIQELITHSCSCLNILNTISSGPVYEAISSTFEASLLTTPCSMLVLAFISASSRSLASIARMVSLLETAISCHFVRLADDELKNSWVSVVNFFIVPELDKDEFIGEAIKQKAFLTLYSYNLHQIPLAQTQGDQLSILINAVQWCTKIQLDHECETKSILLWLQIFDIVRMLIAQYESSGQIQQLAKYMLYLAHTCRHVGEDKTYNGMLGTIGIGRKSSLSPEFRFAAKTLNMFLLCQLPASSVSLRTASNSPGAIRNSPYSNPTAEAEKAFTTYRNYTKNKLYAPMKGQIDWVVDFVSNPQVNVTDGCTLLVYLCKQFFEKNNFIAATIA